MTGEQEITMEGNREDTHDPGTASGPVDSVRSRRASGPDWGEAGPDDIDRYLIAHFWDGGTDSVTNPRGYGVPGPLGGIYAYTEPLGYRYFICHPDGVDNPHRRLDDGGHADGDPDPQPDAGPPGNSGCDCGDCGGCDNDCCAESDAMDRDGYTLADEDDDEYPPTDPHSAQ